MTKLALLAAIASIGLSSACMAGGEFETQSLFYVSIPVDARSARERTPIVGFSVRAKTQSANRLPQIPIVDVRFNGGDSNLRVLGIDGRRFKLDADGSESAAPNWWLIGGIAAAVALVIIVAEETKVKQCDDAAPVAPAPPGGPPSPPPPRDC